MDLARLAAGSPPAEVADTVGVFTNDIRVAQDFFHAGLPFWLTRPASDFGQTTILAAIPLLVPCYYGICFEPHRFNYPIIYQGSASSTQKHEAILRYACNFLCYPDLFTLHINDLNMFASAHKETSAAFQASKEGPGTRAIDAVSYQHGVNKGSGSYGRKGAGAICKLSELLSHPSSYCHNR